MITLITVSDTWNHFREAIEEYRHRLPKSVQYITIAPERSTERQRIIARETERIIDALKKARGRVYLCDETGRTYTTRAFHTFLMREIQEGEVIFIIGGSYGVDVGLLEASLNGKIRFSDFTFPHGLAFLVLLEQIYRVLMIERGSGYHHE